VIVTQLYTLAAKSIARRTRPDQSNRQSFPSGHSSNAFTVAAVASHHYPRLLVPAYALSTFVAVSRLAAAKHHVSDIVAGSGLGFSVGKIVVHRNGRPPDAPPLKSTRIQPDAGPSGDGVGLALHMTF
jgi:membrane-associated phospholipid phosphatase